MPLAPPWPSAPGRLAALWHGRSVRAQLITVVVVIEVIAGLLAGMVTIYQARVSTRVEIAASMELAQLLVSEAVALMQQEVPAEKFLADLASPLRLVRHVRTLVMAPDSRCLAAADVPAGRLALAIYLPRLIRRPSLVRRGNFAPGLRLCQKTRPRRSFAWP